MTPSISVIIPAYNQGQYLAQAISSVIDQSFGDFEIIVVNDGSTDNTAEVAATFRDPRLRVIHQANKGLSGARNSGLRHASSPWVLFLDSDDWLLPGALAAFVTHHEGAPDAGMIIGGWEHHFANDNRKAHQLLGVEKLLPCNLLMGNHLPVHCVLVKRSWIDRVGHFDETLAACEDWDLWLRLVLEGCTFTHFGDPVCAYRIHDTQMTRQALRMRNASLAMLDKVDARMDLTGQIRSFLPQAYAWAYLRAAAREYREGLVDLAREDVAEAIRLYPPLLDDEMSALVAFFRGWACDPSTVDAADYLDTVYAHLPPDLSSLAERRSKEIGFILVQTSFDKYRQGRTREAGALAWRAIRFDSSYLKNRGVVSLLGQAGKAYLLSQ